VFNMCSNSNKQPTVYLPCGCIWHTKGHTSTSQRQTR